MLLIRLETEVEVAMRAPSMKADTAIPNKAKMETRGFGEDWSDLDRSPRRQQEQRHQDRVRPLNEQPVSNDPNPFDSGVGPALGWPPRLKP